MYWWWLRQYDLSRQNSNRSPQWGRPGKSVKYHSRLSPLMFIMDFFSFLWPQICSRPEINPENRFYAVWFTRCQSLTVPFYCIPREIKLQKLSNFLHSYPQNTPKRAWIGILKPSARNIRTCVIETTAPIQTIFCTVTKPPNTHCGWSKQTNNKSKMADDRHLEKSKTAISPQWFDRSARNLALWCTLPCEPHRQLKIWIPKYPTWRTAAILITVKSL